MDRKEPRPSNPRGDIAHGREAVEGFDAGEVVEPIGAEIEAPPSALAESGSFGYLGLRVAQYALLFVATLVVTRELGPEGRAEYALPLALAGGMWVLTHLTLEGAAVRLLSRREMPLREILGGMSFAAIWISIAAVSLTLLVGLSARSTLLGDTSTTAVILAALTVPFLLASQLAGMLLVALDKVRNQGIATATGAAIQLVFVVALALTSNVTPETAVAAALVGFALTGALLVVLLAREAGAAALLPAANGSALGPLLRTGAMLHPASVAIQFAPRLDLILVGAFLTTRDAGLYSLALVLADSMLLAAHAVTISGMPRQLGDEEDDAIRFTFDFTRQSLLLTVGVVLVVAPLAYPFVVLVYGSAFAGATVPFVILLVAMTATVVEGSCRILLIRIASPMVVSGLVVASLAVNVIATVLLIQVLSLAGAALASVLAYWALALATLWVVQRKTKRPVGTIFSRPTADDEVVQLFRSAVARARLILSPQ